MEAKLLAVFTVGVSGVSVSQLCADLGISRQTFYKYRRRWLAEGPPGLVERSRRPLVSPHAIGGDLEDEIVRLRKTLLVDNGAQMIAYQLAQGGWPVPAVSTIHRVLVRRGFVVPQPQKRPRTAVRRFVWPRPNDAWQIDATLWALANGRDIWIMDVLDDHSRVLLAARVCQGPTGQAAWDALCHASAAWGLPAHVMSDNGSCFTGRLQDARQTMFEQHLQALGIHHILSTPGHPQTCGKLERSHQTLKRWLRTQPAARTPEQLQTQLDFWRDHYNHDRPHRALQGNTPAQAWHAAPPAEPGPPQPQQPQATLRTVTPPGSINYQRTIIHLGKRFAGTQVLIINRDNDLAIFGSTGLMRRLTIHHDIRHYPTGPRRQPPPKRIIQP